MFTNIPGIILNNKLIPIDEILEYTVKCTNDTSMPKWEKDIYNFIHNLFDESDTIEQYTSGTTGEAKKIELSKSAMIRSARQTIEYLNIPSATNALLCLPVEYIAGKMMIVRSIVGQMNLLYTEPTSMPSTNGKQKIALCSMVPLQAFNTFSNYEMLQVLDTLLIGGAEIRPELEEMIQTIPIKVYETFGMAETCSHIALRRLNGNYPEKEFSVLPDFKISVDNRNCLVVEADFFDTKIVTNDIIEMVDTNHFRWNGRFDNLINSGGKKIHPEVLENQLECQLYFPVAIMGVEDAELGSKLVLVTEKKNCNDVEELKVKLKELLPQHNVPKEIYLVDEMPRNNSFKIDRVKLKDIIS